jgi:hypothetical protein
MKRDMNLIRLLLLQTEGEEAEHAIVVAIAVTEELFPVFAKSLGYHLHDGFRLCSDSICLLPAHIRKIIEQAPKAEKE